MSNFKLCYIESSGSGGTAYFTTNDLDRQWGDDWNDAPYEHNAGSPYEWLEYMGDRGIAKYEIRKVDFSGTISCTRVATTRGTRRGV